MKSVLQIFNELPLPQEDLFSVERHPLHSDVFVGKDSSGAPAVIYTGGLSHGTAVSVKLRNVLLLPEARVEIRSGDKRTSIGAAVYQCRSVLTPLREYFLVAVASILSSQLDAGEFDPGRCLRTLAELFHELEMPAKGTVQGLWGELFVLSRSSEPMAMLDAWHSDPYEQFDFARGTERLEVKTCAGDDRRHHFTLGQVRPAARTNAIIASVVCARSVGGISVKDLVENLRGRGMTPAQALKLELLVVEALGEEFQDRWETRFDLERARASLRFFRAETIPSVSAEVPDDVFNVHFEARLTERLALSMAGDGPLPGSLLASAWPKDLLP